MSHDNGRESKVGAAAPETVQLLLVDEDPIFRLGFQTWLDQFSDLNLVAEVSSPQAALRAIEEDSEAQVSTFPKVYSDEGDAARTVNVAIVDIDAGGSEEGGISALDLCQYLQAHYPELPILLLSAACSPDRLATAREIGVRGYYRKGTSIAQLIAAIRKLAAGETYWTGSPPLHRASVNDVPDYSPAEPSPQPQRSGWIARRRQQWRSRSVGQIQQAIDRVNQQLKRPTLSPFDRLFLQGHRRELRAARFLVERLFPAATISIGTPTPASAAPPRDRPTPTAAKSRPSSQGRDTIASGSALQATAAPVAIDTKTLQSALFDTTLAKLQSNLPNLSQVPLELDIFRPDKKRELLYLILRKFEEILDELRFSQVQPHQLSDKRSRIILDLWQATTVEFFGKYYTLRLGDREVELASLLLEDAEIVRLAILDKIPLVVDFLAHLLFQTPLIVENQAHQAGSPDAMQRAEALLQNLTIQTANAVVQPLLNHCADIETIKQNFYDRRLLSTREVERFRNDLSWKYRLQAYVNEPKAIYESRYWLLVLTERGIQHISVYAPRQQELQALTGIPQAVTLVLEARDAVAPRLRSAVSFVGSGLVYVLTQVVGRGIGLIGRGILQGIGSSLPEGKRDRQDEEDPGIQKN